MVDRVNTRKPTVPVCSWLESKYLASRRAAAHGGPTSQYWAAQNRTGEVCSSARVDISTLLNPDRVHAGHTSKSMWLLQHLKTLPLDQLVLFLDSDLR